MKLAASTTLIIFDGIALISSVNTQVGYHCDIDADCLVNTFCDRRSTHKCLKLKHLIYVNGDKKEN